MHEKIRGEEGRREVERKKGVLQFVVTDNLILPSRGKLFYVFVPFFFHVVRFI